MKPKKLLLASFFRHTREEEVTRTYKNERKRRNNPRSLKTEKKKKKSKRQREEERERERERYLSSRPRRPPPPCPPGKILTSSVPLFLSPISLLPARFALSLSTPRRRRRAGSTSRRRPFSRSPRRSRGRRTSRIPRHRKPVFFFFSKVPVSSSRLFCHLYLASPYERERFRSSHRWPTRKQRKAVRFETITNRLEKTLTSVYPSPRLRLRLLSQVRNQE